ncbi:MAG TPA: VWA domain-containing protein [Bacteroidales bacterium]|mgnify:CR=1 FL=1|nr:VWA domain-containing protein [Bacteroidales bacterium]
MIETIVKSINGTFVYENPAVLWGLLGIIPLLIWYVYSHTKRAHVHVTMISDFEGVQNGIAKYSMHIPIVFRTLAYAALIIALARPVSIDTFADSTSYGVDIVLALDISGSMLARDLKPDRIEASKDIAARFINSRPQDRIGLVIFSGESFTQCPLTTDHTTLVNLLDEVKTGMIEDGTAIGMGIALAVSRLRESSAISKVVILLTDGVNNRGDIDPTTASELAKNEGIRLYTIGVGSRGKAPYPVQTPFGTQIQYVDSDIDEVSLRKIADVTGGKYYRATNNQEMLDIYKEIDALEKTKIEDITFTTKQEEYVFFVLLAIALLGIEMILKYTICKRFP